MRTKFNRQKFDLNGGVQCMCNKLQGSNIALGNSVTDFVTGILPKTSTGQTGLQVEITMNISSVVILASGVLLSGLLIKHL